MATENDAVTYYDDHQNWRSRATGEQISSDYKAEADFVKNRIDSENMNEKTDEATVAQNEDARERAVAASSSSVRNQDGSTTLKNAAGGDLGTIGADGTFAANQEETTTSHLMRDADGNLRWDNGKLAGVRTKPNQDDPRIPKGGFAAQKQAEMDAASKRYSETGDLAGSMTESSKLENAAIRHNAKLQRPVDKTNVGPNVVVVGGPTYRERHAESIRKNPNSYSPQERKQFLGSENDVNSWSDFARQKQDGIMQNRIKKIEALKSQEYAVRTSKNIFRAERRAAMGEAFGDALELLKSSPHISVREDGRRYAMVKLSKPRMDALNKEMRQNGGKSNYLDIAAYAEVDTNGNIIGTPQLAFRDVVDGQRGDRQIGRYKAMSISHYEPLLRDAYRTLGMNDSQAEYMTSRMTGGYGAIGNAVSSEKMAIAKENNASRERIASGRNETNVAINDARIAVRKDIEDAIISAKKEGSVNDANEKLIRTIIAGAMGQRTAAGSSAYTPEQAVEKARTIVQGQAASEKKDNVGDEAFREISPEEYKKLSPEQQQEYRSKWKKWRSSNGK